VVKVHELAIARTGLRQEEARAAGSMAITVGASADDHKRYHPGAHELAMRWTADADSEQVLGCQILGHRDGQIAKRIDVVATAIFAGLTVDQISDLDLSYAPPLGSPWDALQTGAQAWQHETGPLAGAGRPLEQEQIAP
jgi:NADPH-dependent 2,4-dienoyl-CoA reductase/sulfur reductase-like enzyme